jgi:hypothetical protein
MSSSFFDWRTRLENDARNNGCTVQLHQIPEAYLEHLWADGVEPDLISIMEFCVADPERLKDRVREFSAVEEESAAA